MNTEKSKIISIYAYYNMPPHYYVPRGYVKTFNFHVYERTEAKEVISLRLVT